MCYIFRQTFPFHSELRKAKIATCLPLPFAVFLSPLTFWEARDQAEPGSFFPRMKDPGNEVGRDDARISLDSTSGDNFVHDGNFVVFSTSRS